MNLLTLIRALKDEYKTHGDRELRPDVTVAAIISPYAPEPPAPVAYVTGTASTNAPAPSAWDAIEAAPDGPGDGSIGQAELPPTDAPPTRRRRANG